MTPPKRMVSLDRYVGRIVAGTWLVAVTFFLFLSILIDLLVNLHTHIDKHGADGFELTVWLVQYYAKMTPMFFVTIAPFVTVIACMFAVARLMNANEVVPMLFVGRSMGRVLRPTLYCGLLSAAAMAATWQWVLPLVADTISNTRKEQKAIDTAVRNIALPVREAGRLQALSVQEYVPATTTMRGVRFLIEGTQPEDVVLVMAESASWDAQVGDWRLVDGVARKPVPHGVEETPRPWLGSSGFTPDRVLMAGKENVEADLLAYDDLSDLVRLRPGRADVKLAFHRHITYPLANVLLLLLALPFAVWFERGGRIERVLAAIALCGAYLVVDLICQSLGQRGVPPVVAAWAPTILFGSLGIVMFSSIRS
ncbi:MAG: LptF/LptG family permease [Planctomycetes bacterium]|nr:LptF/LptG family permease [Planctomycetota bacterium]